MKDEIKEILDRLEIVARKHTIEVCDDGNIETMPANVIDELRLSNYSAKLLLDYITNLKEENERLTRSVVSYDEALLKRNNEYEDYKTRNEKAIEYIKENEKEYGSLEDNEKIILNILQGKSDE